MADRAQPWAPAVAGCAAVTLLLLAGRPTPASAATTAAADVRRAVARAPMLQDRPSAGPFRTTPRPASRYAAPQHTVEGPVGAAAAQSSDSPGWLSVATGLLSASGFIALILQKRSFPLLGLGRSRHPSPAAMAGVAAEGVPAVPATVTAVLPPALSPAERHAVQVLVAAGQAHLFEKWAPESQDEATKRTFLNEVYALDAKYPGGLEAYAAKAVRLLREAEVGANPFEGYTPTLTDTASLDWRAPEYAAWEREGMAEMGGAAFVLVAGGLGERLGYTGIKVGLPIDLLSGLSYLEWYCRWLLALGRRCGCPLPLAIMTSAQTHGPTADLLRRANYFGLQPDQVTLLQQDPVPALADGAARFAADPANPYRLLTKPHGHGDVHALLHRSGLAGRWQEEGRRWLVFLQDTNAMAFRAVPALLGLASQQGAALHFCCIPRTPRQEIGAVVRLVAPDRPAVTCNVEYNQLDPLLRAVQRTAGRPEEGDVADSSGWSPFPGNINLLVADLPRYCAALGPTGGAVPEFVNPKYAPGSRTAFTTPTRLECMMQDYARLLPPEAVVGVSSAPGGWVFCPVKRPEALARSEYHQNAINADFLRSAGVAVGRPAEPAGAAPSAPSGLPAVPLVQLLPDFAATLAELRGRFRGAGPFAVSGRSALLLDGDITFEHLQLDGALVLRAAPGCRVTVRRLTVANAGLAFVPLAEGAAVPDHARLRGYALARAAVAEVVVEEPGEYVLDEGGLRRL
eukprot:EG_transcript_4151